MQKFMDESLKNQLISCDIVVWNGVVTRYGSIKDLVDNNDDFRVATPDEVVSYRNSQNETKK